MQMGFSQERWFYYLEEHLLLSIQLSILISGFLFPSWTSFVILLAALVNESITLWRVFRQCAGIMFSTFICFIPQKDRELSPG